MKIIEFLTFIFFRSKRNRPIRRICNEAVHSGFPFFIVIAPAKGKTGDSSLIRYSVERARRLNEITCNNFSDYDTARVVAVLGVPLKILCLLLLFCVPAQLWTNCGSFDDNSLLGS